MTPFARPAENDPPADDVNDPTPPPAETPTAENPTAETQSGEAEYVPPFFLPADDTSANLPVEDPEYVGPITGDEPTPEPQTD